MRGGGHAAPPAHRPSKPVGQATQAHASPRVPLATDRLTEEHILNVVPAEWTRSVCSSSSCVGSYERKRCVPDNPWSPLLDEVLEQCAENLRYLEALEHPPGDARIPLHELVCFAGSVSLRQLLAARCDRKSGFGLEGLLHVRSALYGVLDLAYVLSFAGKARTKLAVRYQDMMVIRANASREKVENLHGDDSLGPLWERAQQLAAQYEDGARDTRRHWSGEARGEVFRVAYAYLDRILGEESTELGSGVKQVVVDATASAVAHADPAALSLLPRDDRGWLPLRDPDDYDISFELQSVVVGSMLNCVLCQRTPKGRLAKARNLHHRIFEKSARFNERFRSGGKGV